MNARGNWPAHVGRCRLDDQARSDIARWGFYNVGGMMCGQDTGRWHGPEGPPNPLNGSPAIRVELPFSEVCMHMRVAGRRMWVSGHDGPLFGGVDIVARMVQLHSDDGSRFSGPITRGEAGLR